MATDPVRGRRNRGGWKQCRCRSFWSIRREAMGLRRRRVAHEWPGCDVDPCVGLVQLWLCRSKKNRGVTRFFVQHDFLAALPSRSRSAPAGGIDVPDRCYSMGLPFSSRFRGTTSWMKPTRPMRPKTKARSARTIAHMKFGASVAK